MEQKSKGGKRAGSGRKPLPEKKNAITVYASESLVSNFGGKEGLRNRIYEYLETISQFLPKAAVFEDGEMKIRLATQEEVKNPTTITFKGSRKPESDLKPQGQPVIDLLAHGAKEDILKQIAAIRAERVPKERDTLFGRKAWALDQKKRIEELEKQLNK